MLFSRRKSQDSSFPSDLLDRLFEGDKACHNQSEEAQIVFLDERTEGSKFSYLKQKVNKGIHNGEIV